MRVPQSEALLAGGAARGLGGTLRAPVAAGPAAEQVAAPEVPVRTAAVEADGLASAGLVGGDQSRAAGEAALVVAGRTVGRTRLAGAGGRACRAVEVAVVVVQLEGRLAGKALRGAQAGGAALAAGQAQAGPGGIGARPAASLFPAVVVLEAVPGSARRTTPPGADAAPRRARIASPQVSRVVASRSAAAGAALAPPS